VSTPASPPRLYGAEFAENPHRTYDALRAAGPVAWAEIDEQVPALVVTSRAAALDVLRDTGTYSKDSRLWAAHSRGEVPLDSPVLTHMEFRPNLLHADGERHERLRRVVDGCLARIDLHQLRGLVQEHARALITRIEHRGHADLMAEYADVLPLLVFRDLLGCPPPLADTMLTACRNAVHGGPHTGEAVRELTGLLGRIIALHKEEPARDLTSWMLDHPAELTDEEVLHQLFVLLTVGTAPTTAWIGATLHTLLTDPDYTENLVSGAVTVRRAMERTLYERSPMANFSVHYARHATTLRGIPIPAGVPIMISHAATGLDPERPGRDHADDRSHLAWSAGPHRCPAESHAAVIAQTAIETAVDTFWDLSTPTTTIANRHSPFHQCPAHLGALYRPRPADLLAAHGPR
jgi:cytochrome P450